MQNECQLYGTVQVDEKSKQGGTRRSKNKMKSECMYLVDISDARVSCLCLAMLVKSLDHLPAPLAILGVLGQSPHQEVGLNCFRSQYVISKAKIDTLR